MPTNFFRKDAKPEKQRSAVATSARRTAQKPGQERVILIEVGKTRLRAHLLPTPTADRLWVALPLFATAETWGDSVHFELPLAMGRDRTSRLNGTAGELYYWSDDSRILIAFGPTPISRPHEIRLPRPCNVFGRVVDDVSRLKDVQPGEKVSIRAA